MAPIHDPEVETRSQAEQFGRDRETYRNQIRMLFERSLFYREKFRAAGFDDAEAVGPLDDIGALPFTEKDEIRASQAAHPPLGSHLAAPIGDVVRIFSTSGTTGAPCYMPLTRADLARWIAVSSRSYSAGGARAGYKLVSTYGAGPFAAGAALEAFNNLGVCHIPVGPGNTERLARALRVFAPEVLACTPSYALYLIEWLAAAGHDPAGVGLKHLLVAGEPGGGEARIRDRIEGAFGALVTEAMGIGDISISVWGECEQRSGMHFCGGDYVHVELIDPESGEPLPWADGATGELVYTALRRDAAPLVRFRSRDHVRVWTDPCACGRATPRVRCIGRTDDMIIVRGVNVFPTAIREVVAEFGPQVSGALVIRPRRKGVRQQPPLPLVVELAEGVAATAALSAEIAARIRSRLIVTVGVDLVPFGSLPRSDYKIKLVDYSAAE